MNIEKYLWLNGDYEEFIKNKNKQYEYVLTNKITGSHHTVFATAEKPEVAFKAVCDYYGAGFHVDPVPKTINDPHQYFIEINCLSK